MAKMPRTPFSLAEVQARAVQLENDAAALFLVRRSIQLEAAASRAGDAGNMTGARNKMGQARAYRAAASRLVLAERPSSLGVPLWLGGVDKGTSQARSSSKTDESNKHQ